MAVFAISACTAKKTNTSNPAFEAEKILSTDDNDFDVIKQSGEIIVAIESGPTTYFEYKGVFLGLQYALIEDFARTEGLIVRVNVCNDSSAVINMLASGNADVGIFEGGPQCWAFPDDSSELKDAIDAWYSPDIANRIAQAQKQELNKKSQVQRHARAMFINRAKGIISPYDDLFKQASSLCGWDWRLIAALCYQESGFDPNARSYVGARGLMQLMPSTAQHLGIAENDITNPSVNVEGGARYLHEVSQQFRDIANAEERIKFTMAAYNGGTGHIKDAQALARTYHKNSQVWEEVAPFVLALMRPEMYRHPVVKHGYMIGTETVNYVQQITERAIQYGANISSVRPITSHSITTSEKGEQHTSPKQNRFTRKNSSVLSPEELAEQ